ncbi:MAG: CRISPR-associated endonuclease Cas6 [Calditrichaceae bacterium]
MKKAVLKLNNVSLKPEQVHKLRGFVGNLFKDHDLIHNHNQETGKVIYRYPLVQFKLIDRVPSILCVTEKAVTVFHDLFMKLDTVTIDGMEIPIFEKDLKLEDVAFGYSDETFVYEFQSPWIGLNQKNYAEYENTPDETARKDLLKRILTGNILSMSKFLDDRLAPGQTIRTDLTVKPGAVKLKGKSMIGFKGVIKTNFIIPDYLGLGKSVSRGFGVVRRII